jgi:hypothetical protein
MIGQALERIQGSRSEAGKPTMAQSKGAAPGSFWDRDTASEKRDAKKMADRMTGKPSERVQKNVAKSMANNDSYQANQVSARANNSAFGTGYFAQRAAHAEAGEAHLKAAAAQEAVGNKEKASNHRERAAEHASAAGDAWDEGKHPRGPDGKFI